MWEAIEYEKKDRIATIRLNRPEAMNTMNFTMMKEIPKALKDAEDDQEIHVIVISHNGPHWGAGFDLKEPWEDTYNGDVGVLAQRNMLQTCVDYEITPWTCAKPVIAMVRGYCLAGSCELAMMCCVTFASENAQFGEPEIRFSTCPPAIVMPWLVGLKKAREILYTGEFISAEEARECGMVNRVFPDDELEEETYRYARRAAAISQEALRTTKAAINRSAELAGFRASLDAGIELGAMLDSTPTDAYVKFEEIRKEKGLSAAIRWRESQFEG